MTIYGFASGEKPACPWERLRGGGAPRSRYSACSQRLSRPPRRKHCQRLQPGYLGMELRDLNREEARARGVLGAGGAEITKVEAGSPAAAAGLKRGDIVLEIDGKSAGSAAQFLKFTASRAPGTVARLRVLRQGKVRAGGCIRVLFRRQGISARKGAGSSRPGQRPGLKETAGLRPRQHAAFQERKPADPPTFIHDCWVSFAQPRAVLACINRPRRLARPKFSAEPRQIARITCQDRKGQDLGLLVRMDRWESISRCRRRGPRGF